MQTRLFRLWSIPSTATKEPDVYKRQFLSSTLCGTVIAALLIGVLLKSGAFKYLQHILEADGALVRETGIKGR